MAGYVCKIVMENTHPPVWRRVIVPEKITFGELHEIIQILFDWQEMHLHAFEIPADHICIDNEGDTWGEHYDETVTLIDSFFKNYKWIRYTYDFGDDWRHRINIEKIDETYQERYVTLLKAKGDNFVEDSGGIWGYDEDAYRNPFQKQEVERRLGKKKLERHDELEEEPLLKESVEKIKDMFERMLSLKPEIRNGLISETLQEMSGDVSAMTKKIDAWKRFEDDERESMIEIVSSEKSVYELMLDLGEREASDYYKYLRLPQDITLLREEKIAAISEELETHPEFLCYIFDDKEYRNLEKLILHPDNMLPRQVGTSTTIVKLLGVGLGDFFYDGKKGTLCLASDIKKYIGMLDAKAKKKIYKKLDRMSDGTGALVQLYGVIDRESLYEIYKKIYDSKQEKTEYERFIYWHLRFNDIIDTAYLLDGTCYVASKQVNAQKIIEKSEKYSKYLYYKDYSADEIAYLTDDLANRSDWMDILFSMLIYEFHINVYEAQDFLEKIASDIFNGETLDDLMKKVEHRCSKYWSVESALEVWSILSGLLLELELPMLKGRFRQEYAEQRGISPWSVGMLSESISFKNTKNCHIYEFPYEVQEQMYDASAYGSEKSYKKVVNYKKEHHICSEEYLYLLAETSIRFGKSEHDTEQLVSELKQSSYQGKKLAKSLVEMWNVRTDVMDDSGDFYEDNYWNYENSGFVQQPYVRKEPKIGRNDPCPCGSGKKYKKCCGKG